MIIKLLVEVVGRGSLGGGKYLGIGFVVGERGVL